MEIFHTFVLLRNTEVTGSFVTFSNTEVTGSFVMTTTVTTSLTVMYELLEGEVVNYVVSGSRPSTTHLDDVT